MPLRRFYSKAVQIGCPTFAHSALASMLVHSLDCLHVRRNIALTFCENAGSQGRWKPESVLGTDVSANGG